MKKIIIIDHPKGLFNELGIKRNSVVVVKACDVALFAKDEGVEDLVVGSDWQLIILNRGDYTGPLAAYSLKFVTRLLESETEAPLVFNHMGGGMLHDNLLIGSEYEYDWNSYYKDHESFTTQLMRLKATGVPMSRGGLVTTPCQHFDNQWWIRDLNALERRCMLRCPGVVNKHQADFEFPDTQSLIEELNKLWSAGREYFLSLTPNP